MPTDIRSTDVTIRIAATLADVDHLGPAWRELETRPGNELSFFQTFSWCRTWLESHGAGATPHVYAVWKGHQLAAILPLMLVNRWGTLRQLRGLGEPHTQYCNLLTDPDLFDRDASAALSAELARVENCDVAVFSGVPETSPLSSILAGFPPVAGYDNAASMLDLSAYADAADYTARLGKLQKRNRNRRRNHLARLGELDFEVIWPGHPQFDALVSRAIAMKKVWLRQSGRYSTGLAARGHDAFLAGLRGDADRLEGACLSVLRVAGEPVALELGFIHHGHYYAYLGGFEWSLRAHSPGKVQMDMTVCWLIDQGITAYDLLGSPDGYKQSWTSRTVGLAARAQPFSWRGHVYAATWLPAVRPAIKRLGQSLPEVLRRLTTLGQSLTCCLLFV